MFWMNPMKLPASMAPYEPTSALFNTNCPVLSACVNTTTTTIPCISFSFSYICDFSVSVTAIIFQFLFLFQLVILCIKFA